MAEISRTRNNGELDNATESAVQAIAPARCRRRSGDTHMQDAVMLLFTVVFFVLAFLYVKACQKLR
jgi:hypothetical protein